MQYHYKVVNARTLRELEGEVNNWLAEGWSARGDLQIKTIPDHGTFFFQVLEVYNYDDV